ncbi:MAG: exo-alpha-sialidase [Candidatus Omnitrophica bacterium]|nr:exo-alpha-sialidase [Candidatus Omnitrophota bacterium]
MRRFHPRRVLIPVLSLLFGASNLADCANPPRDVAEFPDKPVIRQRPDGELLAFFMRTLDGTQTVTVSTSPETADNWSAERPLLALPKGVGGWGGPDCLIDKRGNIHLIFLNDANTGVIPTGEENRPRAGSLHSRRLDIWHAKSTDGGATWKGPNKIWEGYTGALNSIIETSRGWIVLPFSCLTPRTWGNRGDGLDAFTFRGQFDSTVVYSEDGGETWKQSPTPLKVATPDIVSAYGAVEPVVLELKDGRIWMLIRTQLGRFYESFSKDGAEWSPPRPTAILSSDSPGGITRLPDGRIVLFWNNSLRFPYAYGGRQVLHAAISEDEGRTWRGCREVARDPLRHEPPPPSGDHGTAYPFPTALRNGKVIYTTGQGTSARILCRLLDPDWLLETEQRADFSVGLDDWSVFGTRGVELIDTQDGNKALRIRKVEPGWPAAAVWNFPSGPKGTLTVRLHLEPGNRGYVVGLTDHYSVPFDEEDLFHNLFSLDLTSGISDGKPLLAEGKAYELRLSWDLNRRECRAELDGVLISTLLLRRESGGVSYVRFRSVLNLDEREEGGLVIESVEAKLEFP